jgi:predicted nucleic acid-binding protein
VYRYDPRFAAKQKAATSLLSEGLESGEAHLSHQSLIEFVSATTRPLRKGGESLLDLQVALAEAESLLSQFPVLYPDDRMLRLAMRGAAAYGLSWFDALMWAYAEHFGIATMFSEDFQHDRLYGSVRIVNPFV